MSVWVRPALSISFAFSIRCKSTFYFLRIQTSRRSGESGRPESLAFMRKNAIFTRSGRVVLPERRVRTQHGKRMELRIAVLQTDPEWAQPARNLARAGDLVASSGPMWRCCPRCSPRGSARIRPPWPNRRRAVRILGAMRRWAARCGCAVAGSVAVAAPEGFRNRMYFVEPSGRTTHYDKRHLFSPGGEARGYLPGERRVVVRYRGVRFLLLVCYDLRFPSGAAVAGLRRHPLLRFVARAATRGGRSAGPGDREPMLRRRREPRGMRSGGALRGGFRTRRFPGPDPRRGRCGGVHADGWFDPAAAGEFRRRFPPDATPTSSFSDSGALFFRSECRIFTARFAPGGAIR